MDSVVMLQDSLVNIAVSLENMMDLRGNNLAMLDYSSEMLGYS